MYDLTAFTLGDMTDCSATLRKLGSGAGAMDEVADRIVRHFYDHLRGGRDGPRACVLCRFFLSRPYGSLPEGLRRFACRRLADREAADDLKCLALLATTGDQPAWNRRDASQGHQAIPLPSAELWTQLPMIAQLVQQFGLEPSLVLKPDPAVLVDHGQRTYNVFHVAEARGSPYVPAQEDFVVPHGVRSVLGFGGLLSTGDLFAVILFARVPLSRETAELFKPLALSVKLAVLPFAAGPIFT